MTFYTITIDDTGEVFRCKPEESVLAGMDRLGKRGIPVGCRGGGCGVCKVHIHQGEYQKRVMSRDHVSPEEEAMGTVLACRICPGSDLHLSVLGCMKKKVCAGQSGANQ